MGRAYRKSVAIFFLRGLTVWLLWYLLYDVWLAPRGNFDHVICRSLVACSGSVLKDFGFRAFVRDRVVGLAGTGGIIIIDPCNGLEAMGLFLGFVHAFPGQRLRRWLFSFAGLIALYLANVIRIIVLVLTQRYWPGLFNFTHHYSTTALFYIVIFMLWVVWARWGIGSTGLEKQLAGGSSRQGPAT